jgi:DNA-3-methyladenine glycosylase
MESVILPEWFVGGASPLENRSAVTVAPELIGCTLVRQLPDGRQLRGIIVETEAYQEGDPACHAYRKQTKRNLVMFGDPGYVYVYLIYGMYHCVNVVTDKAGTPSAVLIRALELEQNTLASIPLKPREKLEKVAAGPGKLCRAMQIDLDLYGTKLELGQALWLEHRSIDWQNKLDVGSIELTQTTRIGLTQAGWFHTRKEKS